MRARVCARGRGGARRTARAPRRAAPAVAQDDDFEQLAASRGHGCRCPRRCAARAGRASPLGEVVCRARGGGVVIGGGGGARRLWGVRGRRSGRPQVAVARRDPTARQLPPRPVTPPFRPPGAQGPPHWRRTHLGGRAGGGEGGGGRGGGGGGAARPAGGGGGGAAGPRCMHARPAAARRQPPPPPPPPTPPPLPWDLDLLGGAQRMGVGDSILAFSRAGLSRPRGDGVGVPGWGAAEEAAGGARPRSGAGERGQCKRQKAPAAAGRGRAGGPPSRRAMRSRRPR
jgi:hypothetical protein